MLPSDSRRSVLDNRSRLLDVSAVFDTTGSMSNKIHGLVQSMASVVGSLGRLQLDWRFVCVPFGDLTVPGDRVVDDLPFTASVASAQRQLRSLPRFSGGSNLGESSAEAMLAALDRDFRPNAVKVVVLITDEPALGRPQVLQHVGDRLTATETLCFTISPALPYFRDWANLSGGTWQLIGNSVDQESLARLFEDVMNGAGEIVDEVHHRDGGSVRRYLERVAAVRPAAGPVRVISPGLADASQKRRLTRASTRSLPSPARIASDRQLGPGRER
jgi:hypothetical protein